MNKTYSLFILLIASIGLLSSYKVDASSQPELLKLLPQGVDSQNHQISQNIARDTSTLEKAILGRWVSEPLIAGKNMRLTYNFIPPNIWITGQEVEGRPVPGEQLRYKVIKVDEKQNSLQIRYGLVSTPELLDSDATVVLSPDRQGLSVIFHANGLDIPSLKPFKYAGTQ